MVLPLRYTPSVEVLEDDEQKTQAELIETLLGISKTTLRDEHEALRAVHAKSQGLLKATFIVADGLPPELAQGLFAKPGRYDAVMRLSSAPGDLLPDSVSTHHGLGIKVKGVGGEHLPGAESDTQDFLMANGKAFNASSLAGFLKTLKLLAATTDKAEGLKVALSTALRAVETTLENAGGQSALLTALGGHPAYHILAEEFFTQVPIRYGDCIAKLRVYPVSPGQKSLIGTKIELSEPFDAHRQAVRKYLENEMAVWEIRAQLCTDLETMPVEKPNVAWPEDKSPYLTVARIEVAPQEAYSDAMVAQVDKGAAFSPWHGLVAHRPLGAINRVRKAVYDASARFRLSRNGCPFHGEAA
ncbi:MAG TPA: catalase family protein [Rhizomicrobium sp.]|jgi:hypothetical protein|nr:catalase family protein [Rhizomicrobium sp.]